MKKAVLSVFLALGLFFAVTPAIAAAEAPSAKTILTGNINPQRLGLKTESLRYNVILGLKYLLGFAGLVCVCFVIYAGIIWMTARGNEDKVADAKGIIFNAMIGFIVTLFSYSIVQFVGNAFKDPVVNNPAAGSSEGRPKFATCLIDSDCASGKCVVVSTKDPTVPKMCE